MAVVVVGGHSRNIGKTSVVAGLIAALPACNWIAFKITQFGHPGHPQGIRPPGGAATWRITEESDRSGKSDTSRFLVAGAKQAFLVETEDGHLYDAIPAIQHRLASSENAIVESNSILEFIRPDLYVVVLDPATKDFKASAQKYLDRADAVVLHEGPAPGWTNAPPTMLAACPVFCIVPPQYVCADLVEFVSQRLKARSGSPAWSRS